MSTKTIHPPEPDALIAGAAALRAFREHTVDLVFAILDWRDIFHGFVNNVDCNNPMKASERFVLETENWRSVHGHEYRKEKLGACNRFLKQSAQHLLILLGSWNGVTMKHRIHDALESFRSAVDSFDERVVADIQYVSIALLGTLLQVVLKNIVDEPGEIGPGSGGTDLHLVSEDEMEANTLRLAVRECRRLLLCARLEERHDQKSPDILPAKMGCEKLLEEDFPAETSQLHLRGGGNQKPRHKRSKKSKGPKGQNPRPATKDQNLGAGAASETVTTSPFAQVTLSRESLEQNELGVTTQPNAKSSDEDSDRTKSSHETPDKSITSNETPDKSINSNETPDKNMNSHEDSEKDNMSAGDSEERKCPGRNPDKTKSKAKAEPQYHEYTEKPEALSSKRDEMVKIVSKIDMHLTQLKALLNDDQDSESLVILCDEDQDSESQVISLEQTERSDSEGQDTPNTSRSPSP